MLSLDELGATPSSHFHAKIFTCSSADSAVRMLAQMADAGNEILPAHRVRMLTAVVHWIEDDQAEQAETRAGMARTLLEMARVVGKG